MKKFTSLLLLQVVLFLSISLFSQTKDNQQRQINPPTEIDPRVDNMGYWKQMAELGLVPYNAEIPVKPAEYKGSLIEIKGITVADSPDIPVTNLTNVTESENSVFVDPNNNQYILNSNNSTSWNGSTVGTLYGANYFISTNGGSSWGGSASGAGGSNSGDPTTAIGLNGRKFVNYIDNPGGQGVAYSDNGISWSTATIAPNPGSLADKNHMWIDNSPSSSFNGNVYAAWTDFGGSYNYRVVFSRSTNNGGTWSTRIPISNSASYFSHGVNLQTGPAGEVYACWAIYASGSLTESSIGFTKSTNGGASFSTATTAITNIKGIRETGVLKSMRVNSFPVMAVDISGGPNNGNIYIVWTNIGTPQVNTGTNKSIYMIRSTDGGVSWSTPVKVNQGAFTNGKEAYFPWITCDPSTGTLAVVFYDDRNTSSSSCETWVAYSTDAGSTWTDFRVSDVSFTPNPIPGLASSYMGDYLGITGKDNVFYPCWTDTRNGLYMTYVSPFTLGLNAAFTANNTNICTGSSVTFTNQSTGNPTSWNWSFPGGTPSSYSGANPPAITYNTPGTYNVSLTVSDGTNSDTETKTGYITVSNVIADFTASQTTIIVGNSVTFTNNSSCNPSSWSWSFPGGTPSSFIGANPPAITYNTLGSYNVSLTVSNANGTDTETKTNYINVINCTYCTSGGNNGAEEWISNVTFNTINNNSSAGSGYTDYSGISTNVLKGNTYTASVSCGSIGTWTENIWIFIDFNQDCDFDDAGESFDLGQTSGPGTRTLNITIPVGATSGSTRMRASLKYSSDPSPCETFSYGEVEDYTLIVASSAIPPVANFSASTTTPYIGQTVTFTDLSTNTPTSWSWSFSPTTVTYVGGTSSTSQHPQVQFNAAGYYTVTLTATNAAGSDGETKTNYILASVAPPVANFSASTTTPYVGQTVTFTDLSTNTPTSWSWSFSPTTVTYVGGTSSTSQHPQVQFNAAGYYTVTLTATNAGGSDGETKTNYILASVAPPVADFSASTTTPIVGQTVAFTDLSINTPTSWSWSFTPSTVIYVGGTSSSSQNPQVQFNAGGYYTVTLTATNAGGSDGETKTNYINALVNPPVATLKLGSLDNPAPGTVLVPVTLEAISNPVLGNNLISSWAWYVAYDASVLYNAAPSMPANLTNFNAQFPSANYVTNIIENHPSPGWNTIAIIYAAAVSGTGSAGLKFFDIVFTYNQGTTACPNLYWTSTSISETNMADDEGNDFVLTLENGCIWSDPPVADFMASTTTPTTVETVNFTDLSTNYPTSWAWSFSPATVTYIGGTTSTSQNPQVRFDASGYYTITLIATNALGSDTEIKTDYINVQSAIINLDVSVYLEGPFNGSGMTPSLNSLLPLSHPYNLSPWNYGGTESVVSIPNANIVDWVMVELRDASNAASATSATMLDRQAAFLLSNGKVVGLDGSSILQFSNSITQQLFVIIWHRNHIPVMTANNLVENSGIYSYDFSSGATQAFGGSSAHKQIAPGVWGMISGDGNHDGSITLSDKSPIWETQAGTQGYMDSDYNMDSQSDNKDKDDNWAPNLGKGSQVPN